jgi:uncharacterized protein
MSGAQPPPGEPAGNDPSMEDILASIRRILSEDEPATPIEETPATAAAPAAAEPEDDVLVLDESMLVHDQDPEPAADPEPVGNPEPAAEPEPIGLREIAAEPAPAEERVPMGPESLAPGSLAPELLGPEAAAAASSSVGSLMRTLAMERSTQVYHGGPTIEDIVREEVRPLLKQWLDVNLPPLVERLVRIEIERVVGRAVP